MKAKGLLSLVGGVLMLSLASQAEAQGFKIVPWVGLYAPTDDLGSVQAVNFGKRESTLAYGANLEFGRSDRVVNFRIGGSYGTDSDVPIEGVGCPACAARSTLLTASGTILLRPIPNMPVFRPYLLAGAGAKWYDFDFDSDEVGDFIEDQTQFAGVGGLGFTLFPDGALSLFAELTDYISGFDFEGDDDSDLQHDLFFKAGLSIGIGRR